MDSRLLEILIQGDVQAFCQLLYQDPLLLDSLTVLTSDNTPLHVVSLLGHEELAGEILRRSPGQVNYRDARGFYPIHIAAAKGHFGIANKILETNPLLSRCRDKDGQTPLHLAAANGHAALLGLLLPRNESFSMMVTETGKTVLHLSVKFNQVEVVKFLLEGHKELINLKDEGGMTALHLASAKRNVQIVRLLLQEISIEVNALNENGCTALDILIQCPSDVQDIELCDLLLCFGGKKGVQCESTMIQQQEQDKQQLIKSKRISRICKRFQSTNTMQHNKDENWLKDMRDDLMIVSTVIASATFQAGLNPPHATNNYESTVLFLFLFFDTIALCLSMSIILFLSSGLFLKNRFMTWILVIMLWASISSMAISFLYSGCIVYNARELSQALLFTSVLFWWFIMIGCLVLYYLVLLLVRFIKYLSNSCCSSLGSQNDP